MPLAGRSRVDETWVRVLPVDAGDAWPVRGRVGDWRWSSCLRVFEVPPIFRTAAQLRLGRKEGEMVVSASQEVLS
jgi:hypothetical protein